MSKNTTNCVIVVPVYRSPSKDEEISLRHLNHFLNRYEKCFVAPEGLNTPDPSFDVRRFDPSYFTGTDSYSRLLLSPHFYESFSTYEYILIYQLDCLVFSDQLVDWCNKGFDYIGAPLPVSKTDPEMGLSRVGNGGFSLRKVKSFLNVLESKRYLKDEASYLKDLAEMTLPDLNHVSTFRRFIKKLKVLRQVRKGVVWYIENYTLNEDRFWSDRAKLFYPEFNIAPVDVSLKYAFEIHPRYCYELNNSRLPFGCHAWAKWDREFWVPFLKYG